MLKEMILNWLVKDTRAGRVLRTVMRPIFSTFTNRNSEAYIEKGYKRNVIVYRCVSQIARSAARIPLVVFSGTPQDRGERIDDHWLLDVLMEPNPVTDQVTLLEAHFSFLMITGNGYMEAVTVDNGERIQELWVLPSQNITVKPGNFGFPELYQMKAGTETVEFEVDDDGRSDLFHLKLYNPDDYFVGQSPLDAGMFSVDQHNQASIFNNAMLQNQATPSGAMVYDPKNPDADDSLSDTQYNRLKEEIATEMQGATNAGKPLVLDGGMKWVPMGMSPAKDMGFIENKQLSAKEIALAYHVPPQFVGILEASTYNNVAEAKLDLYEQGVLPVLGLFCRSMTLFARKFDDATEWFLWYDEDKIQALEPRRQLTFERALKAIEGSLLSVNEAREMVGRDTVEGGEQIMVSAGKLPLDFEPMPPNEDDG